MDRPGIARTALLAVLLLVASIFAARSFRGPDPLPREEPSAGRPRVAAPLESEPGDAPKRLPGCEPSEWLPALEGGTRTVLAQFSDGEPPLPPGAESTSGPTASDDGPPALSAVFGHIVEIPYLAPTFDASPSVRTAESNGTVA